MSDFIGKTYASKEALEKDVQLYALKHGFAVTTLHLNGDKDSGYLIGKSREMMAKSDNAIREQWPAIAKGRFMHVCLKRPRTED